MKKGQIGTVYKLLISSAFAIALLVIVYNYTSSIQSPITGIDVAQDVLGKASDSRGLCFSRDPVKFQEGQTYNHQMFEDVLGLSSLSVEPKLPKSIYDPSDDVFKANLESSLSAICNPSCKLYLGSSNCG